MTKSHVAQCAPRAMTMLLSVLGLLVVGQGAHAEDLQDPFDNDKTLASWKIRDDVEGGGKTYEEIGVGTSRRGWLTMRPRPSNGWYQDGMGPMLYKDIKGDFLVETNVATESRNHSGQPPQAQYNSAGLIVRDPASRRGSQNWVVVNTGYQSNFAGSEVKTTVNSKSVLELQRGSHNGRLRLARIGSTIYALRMLAGETKWTLIKQFERKDLPNRVQVGIMCNGWSNRADLIAHFDYVRYSTPAGVDGLTRK